MPAENPVNLNVDCEKMNQCPENNKTSNVPATACATASTLLNPISSFGAIGCN